MSAAVLQGVPATTLDTDIWIDLLPLESIIRSKEAVRREKDIAHLPLLRKTLELSAKTKR